jgi:hypothetical protein
MWIPKLRGLSATALAIVNFEPIIHRVVLDRHYRDQALETKKPASAGFPAAPP